MNEVPDNSRAPKPGEAESAPVEERPPAAEGATKPAKPAGLPFDPLRLVTALLRRWLLIVISGAVLGVLGGLGAYYKFSADYKAGAQLMRQEPSSTFRASEMGEPFKPRQLSVTTLVGFMKSPAVMQRVAEQVQLPARMVSGGLTITPERNTDLINLTYTTKRSRQTAARVLNAFGNEVVRMTREMQSQEASEINRLLKRQVAKADDDLRTINNELLEFSKQAGIINADKEIDAYLRSLGDVDMKFETMRIDYETADLKIAALEKELALNNPMAERLTMAREKLEQMLQQFTPANPLVEEQKGVVAELEAKMKESEDKPMAAPRQGESGLATTFYTELMSLKTQKQVISAQLEKLKTVRSGLEDKLKGLPEKGMQLARMKARQQALESAQALLTSRQREAQVYEENPLGYYRFFDAKVDDVEMSGRGKKVIMVTVAAGFFGVFLAVFGVCLVESFDDRIVTKSDLKRVTKLPLLATLPDLDDLDSVAQANWSFRTWLALKAKFQEGPRGEIVCGWLSAHRSEGCSTWVDLLARAAAQRSENVLVVTNHAPVNGAVQPLEGALADPASVGIKRGTPRWLLTPPDWHWDVERRRQWRTAMENWTQAEGLVVLVALTKVDQPETLLFEEDLTQLVWVARSGFSRSKETAERLFNMQNAGCRFAGTVLNSEPKILPWA